MNEQSSARLCFRCDKELEPVVGLPELTHEGLEFVSRGGFGSQAYDPISPGNKWLSIHVCDDCLTRNASMVTESWSFTPPEEIHTKPWNPNEDQEG